jgi:tetratricopeptide (TPR) repeat protein
MRFWLAIVVALGLAAVPSAAKASTALELVRIAKEHEKAKAEDLALRRYMEALRLDPTCEEAYLGLGSRRARRGDLHEAERVYSVALEHLPQLREARVSRAYVRRALGAHNDAIADLITGSEDDVSALRILAGWYGEDGLIPAQLSVWRRILVRAEAMVDANLLREARTMVRALVILVGPADPAAAPADDKGPRQTMRMLARKALP